MEVKWSSTSKLEERITEQLPHDDEGAQAETMLRAMRGYMLGRKGAPTAAEKAHYDELSSLVLPAEPFGKEDFSSYSATPDPWMSSNDRTTVDKRSHGGVEDPRDTYEATDFCPSFPEHQENIDCPDGSDGVEADIYFHRKLYLPEDERTRKDKNRTLLEEMEVLTESVIGEINSWMTEYLEGVFVERMKRKVEEIREHRLHQPKGKTKVSFGKTVVETEAEAPPSDLSTSETKLVPDTMAELQEEMKQT